jgi:hypothetical protein
VYGICTESSLSLSMFLSLSVAAKQAQMMREKLIELACEF